MRPHGALEMTTDDGSLPGRHHGDADDFLRIYLLATARASDERAPEQAAFIGEVFRASLVASLARVAEEPDFASLPEQVPEYVWHESRGSTRDGDLPEAVVSHALLDLHRRLRAKPDTIWRPGDGVTLVGAVVQARTALLVGVGPGRVSVLRRGRIVAELARLGIATRADLGSAPPLGQVRLQVLTFDLEVGDVIAVLSPAMAHLSDADIVERAAGFSPPVAAAELCALASKGQVADAGAKEHGCIVGGIQADDDN